MSLTRSRTDDVERNHDLRRERIEHRLSHKPPQLWPLAERGEGQQLTSQGHLKRRRGIIEHVQDGRLTLQELGAHDLISMMADKATGIWRGSAKALSANCGKGDISERHARRIMDRLEQHGYIKRFATPGKRGNYPILVNKYEVTFGARLGTRLNAIATTDYKNPVYEVGEVRGEVKSPSQDMRKETLEEPTPKEPVEVKPKKAREKKLQEPLPEPPISLGPLPEWLDFIEHRAAIGEPLTRIGAIKVFNKLEKLRARGHPPGELLDAAVESGWRTVYEPFERRNGNGKQRTDFTETDRALRKLANV